MTVGLDFHAVTMPELPFYGDTRPGKPVDQRVCLCGTVLSRFNSSDTCWPCEERSRDTYPSGPVLAHYTGAGMKRAQDSAQRDDAAMKIIRKLPDVFSTFDYADAARRNVTSAGSILNALKRHGLIERTTDRRRSGRDPVAQWRVKL